MTTEFEQFIAGKPACFAVPKKFHLLRPACETCTDINACGSAVQQMVQLSHLPVIGEPVSRSSSSSSVQSGLADWQSRKFSKYTPYSQVWLENLAMMATIFLDNEPKVDVNHRNGSVASTESDLEREKILEVLLNELADIGENFEIDEFANETTKKGSLPPATEAELVGIVDSDIDEDPAKSFECKLDSMSATLSNTAPLQGHGGAANVIQPIAVSPSFSSIHVTLEVPPYVSSPLPSVKIPVAQNDVAPIKVYSFPLPEDRAYDQHTNDELTVQLTKLIQKGFQKVGGLGYAAIRVELCAINIEMNYRQKLAPRFRPNRRFESKDLETDDEQNMSRDRQVIDIHWRAFSCKKPTTSIDQFPTIFDNDPFDLAAAESFSLKPWTPSSKATHLLLTDEMQWENAMIQNTGIRDKWRTIERGYVKTDQVVRPGAGHVERDLQNAMACSNKPHLARHIPGMVATWMAQKIVGDSPKKIAQMLALMSGGDLRDERAVKRTLESLNAHLKQSRKSKGPKVPSL